jgi:hypothetical protein
MKQLWPTFPLVLFAIANSAHAQATATASVSIGAEAGLIVPATPNFSATGGAFGAFIGTTNLTYFIRTSQTGGSGSIQMKVTTDFSPATGPSASAGNLIYTCSGTNPGNSGTLIPCSGSIAASTTAQTQVTSFGPDARSSAGGNSASVQWSLKNDPGFKAGSYSATVTFTVSAN